MPSIHILYEAKDHLNKATALMTALVNEATIDPVDATPVAKDGLTTLIFWGHGSATGLCGKSGTEILKIIKKWRDVNANLRMVEIITCNSRHFDGVWLPKKDKDGEVMRNSKGKQIDDAPKIHLKSRLTHLGKGSKINNSMAKQVKRGLKYSLHSSMRNISLKSMPESANGSFNQYSILYWDPATSTWCYVNGPTEKDMFTLGNCVRYTKKIPADPPSLWGGARAGGFPTRLDAATVEFGDFDFSDVRAGTIGNLRDILVDIR